MGNGHNCGLWQCLAVQMSLPTGEQGRDHFTLPGLLPTLTMNPLMVIEKANL